LAAAAADAAAEQDADEAEEAIGDAPTCPLCLCSRKQVRLHGCLARDVHTAQHSVRDRHSSVSPCRRQPALRAVMCFVGDVLLVRAVWLSK
jgi:hypothetical protein